MRITFVTQIWRHHSCCVWVAAAFVLALGLLALRSIVADPARIGDDGAAAIGHGYSRKGGNQSFPASAVVLVYGYVAGIEAGHPAVAASLYEHVILPAIDVGTAVDLYVCVESPMPAVIETAFHQWGLHAVGIFQFDADKHGRRNMCYDRALSARHERGLGPPDVWVATRTDQIFFSHLPLLHAFAHKVSATGTPLVHARARMAHLYDGLTTDHFSWLFNDNTGGVRSCVEYCDPPCSRFKERFLVADDMIHVLSHVAAPAFFSARYEGSALAAGMAAPPCSTCMTTPKDLNAMKEMLFTCLMLHHGIAFEPMAVAARVNPHSRRVKDFWSDLQWPLKPAVAKDCS
jgi:hypothetical protein